MGRLSIKANECKYTQTARCLKEQFINRLNDDAMIVEIIRELMVINDINTITSYEVFSCTKRIKVLRSQTAMLASLKETEDFDGMNTCKS